MKSLYNTGGMLKTLLRRDWVKLLVWLIIAVTFTVSGSTKLDVMASNPSQVGVTYTMFQNPAMVGLMGPTQASVDQYHLGALFSQTMLILTAILLGIISITYVINRTRKEEDDGVVEILRSFQVGKLANTTSVILVLFFVHLLISLAIVGTLQAQNLVGLNDLGSNLLLGLALGGEGFMWGMIALVFAQLFPTASGAKGASFIFFGFLYIIRMGYDSSHIAIGWLNPLSWVYLTNVYVQDNWTPIWLILGLSLLLIIGAYVLEMHRDTASGYLPEAGGRLHARAALLSFPGLTLRLQRNAIFGWSFGLFILGLVYGSLFGQIDAFIADNPQLKKMFEMPGVTSLSDSFLATIVMVISFLATGMALLSILRMVSEERKNREEQLYATPLSRRKVFGTYILIACILAIFGTMIGDLGLYLGQVSTTTAPMSFLEVMGPGLVWVVPIIFILGVAGLMMGFVPRWSSLAWLFLAYGVFNSYLGRLISLPKGYGKVDVFSYIPKLPIESMDWGKLLLILTLALILFVLGWWGYKNRDLVGG